MQGEDLRTQAGPAAAAGHKTEAGATVAVGFKTEAGPLVAVGLRTEGGAVVLAGRRTEAGPTAVDLQREAGPTGHPLSAAVPVALTVLLAEQRRTNGPFRGKSVPSAQPRQR
jgi:hypothetical protein